jgi:hypothetical protein
MPRSRLARAGRYQQRALYVNWSIAALRQTGTGSLSGHACHIPVAPFTWPKRELRAARPLKADSGPRELSRSERSKKYVTILV